MLHYKSIKFIIDYRASLDVNYKFIYFGDKSRNKLFTGRKLSMDKPERMATKTLSHEEKKDHYELVETENHYMPMIKFDYISKFYLKYYKSFLWHLLHNHYV